MLMSSLVYASTHAAPLTPTALRLIVERARIRNKRLSVTGALVYDGKRFMQCLEGPEPAVEEIYAAIGLDARHKDVTLVFKRPMVEREFADWQMGFVSTFADDRVASLRELGLAGGEYPVQSARKALAGFAAAATRSPDSTMGPTGA